MLTRILRLSDRIGVFIIKWLDWAGTRFLLLLRRISWWFSEKLETVLPARLSAETDTQVSSLSNLIVALLASVTLILLWATTPREQNSPIQLFTISNAQPPSESVNNANTTETEETDNPLAAADGSIVFSMYVGAQQEIFALEPGHDRPTRLTDNPADDRHPRWSPDGQRIAFTSQRDGNWELYVLNLQTGSVSRLTYDLAYEASPTWSGDGMWLAYEAYYNGNLDIFIVPADGSSGPQQLTRSPAADHSPSWRTDRVGREIAYVSHREDNSSQDIFLISLNNPQEEFVTNLTNTPTVNEDNPAWSPDGSQLAYSAVENGLPLIYVVNLNTAAPIPRVIGQGKMPAWSPNGNSLTFISDLDTDSLLLTGQVGTWNTSARAFTLPGFASHPDWSSSSLPTVLRGDTALAAQAPLTPAYEEQLSTEPSSNEGDALYRLVNLQSLGITAESPYLSDRVDGSFSAMRQHINRAAGWDFLGQLGSVLWDRRRPAEPGQEFRSWHKAGRAFDVVQQYSLGDPAQIELIPYRVGPELYWRLFVRAAIQDGSLGEPLKALPWDFNARFGNDVEAYERGGRLRNDIPSGYYVDFTEIARLYGWTPVPAHSSWQHNWTGIRFWQYEKHGSLSWWDAMREIYSEESLITVFGDPSGASTPVPVTATPFPSPTPATENQP